MLPIEGRVPRPPTALSMIAQRTLVLPLVASLLMACPSDPEPSGSWALVHSHLSGALLSVWGTSYTDVWAVGGDARDGTGPR